MTHTKQQIITILENPAAVDAAIIILANNQTSSELRSKSTHNLNGEGFSAAYGKVGTRFYEFVTGIQMSSGTKKWPARSATRRMRIATRYVALHRPPPLPSPVGFLDPIESGVH